MNRTVSESALQCLLAPNPGPMTLDGTNTWIVGDPTAGAPVVVDPGPDDPGHLADVLDACGGRAAAILLTHRHLDHSEGAPLLAAQAGCAVRAADPAWCRGPAGLVEGDEVAVGDQRLLVVATPGHTDDSVSLLLTGSGPPRLLTGDTVLGRGTTVIAAPDGDLAAYLDSLARLLVLVEDREVAQLLPGHGPVVDRPGHVVREYLAHREQRLVQVRAAVRAGAVSAQDVVETVYADVDRSLWPAAAQSVQAQLRYLESHD